MATRQGESTTTTPEPPRCAFCDNDHPEHIYYMGSSYVCDFHIALTVKLAAEAVFPDCVSFSYNLHGILDGGGRY